MTHPKWDAKSCATSTDLIKTHFQQIWGIDGASYPYLLHEKAIPFFILKTVVSVDMDFWYANDQMLSHCQTPWDSQLHCPTRHEPLLLCIPIRLCWILYSASRSWSTLCGALILKCLWMSSISTLSPLQYRWICIINTLVLDHRILVAELITIASTSGTMGLQGI